MSSFEKDTTYRTLKGSAVDNAVLLDRERDSTITMMTKRPTSFQVIDGHSLHTTLDTSNNRSFVRRASQYVIEKRKSIYNAVVDKKILIKGIVMMLFSAFLFSLLVVLVKYGSNDYGYSSAQLLMVRGLIQFIIVSILLFIKKYKQYKEKNNNNNNNNNNDQNSPMLSRDSMSINTANAVSHTNNNNNNKNKKNNKKNNNNEYKTRQSITELFEHKSKLGWLILRGMFGAAAGVLYFEAVTLIPIGDAIATFSLYPVATSFLAYFFLKEQIIKIHIIALLFAIGGGILESQPEFIFGTSNDNDSDSDDSKYEQYGYLCSVIAAIFAGFSFISMRKLKNFDKNYIVLSYSMCCILFGLIFSFVFSPHTLKIPNYDNNNNNNELKSYLLEWSILIGTGIVGYCANVTMTYSAQLIQSGLSSLIRSTDTIHSYIFQIVLFDEIPSILTVCGAALIMSSVALVSLAKYKQSIDKEKQEKLQRLKDSQPTKIVLP